MSIDRQNVNGNDIPILYWPKRRHAHFIWSENIGICFKLVPRYKITY